MTIIIFMPVSWDVYSVMNITAIASVAYVVGAFVSVDSVVFHTLSLYAFTFMMKTQTKMITPLKLTLYML